jgi:hypothetical protein
MKVSRKHMVAGLLAAADRFDDMAGQAPRLAPHLADTLRAMSRDMVRYAAYAETCDGFEFVDKEDDSHDAS